MKNKLKKLLVACVACLTFLVCGIFAACGGTEKVAIDGFEVKETVNVDYGSLVKLETPIVTDQNGKFYDVMTDVCDSKGGYVVVQANSFRAWDIGGYTIRYVVRVSGSQLEERTTAVTVTDTQALTVTATYNEFEDTDKNIFIRPECDETGVEWSFEVKKLKDESGVSVTADEAGAYFVCDEAGYYDVEITAKKGEKYGSFGYTLIVREAVDETVVEHFDEQWTDVAQYLGDERLGRYELVSSNKAGLKDRYGDDAYFLTFTSVAEWLTYHISPRYDKAHYEALLAEGYDKVTLYCYVASEQNKAHTYAIRTMTSGFYERSPVTTYPNQWNEISMNLDLIHGSEVSRSFLAAFEYYKSQEGWFLCYNNEGPEATRDVLTLYFSDMYVTKPVTVSVTEGAATTFAVGDTIAASAMNTLFTSESELRYYVNFRGERKEITEDYTFKANGEYVFEAIPARKDERGGASVTVTVTDEFAVNASYVAEERTADVVEVNLSELNAAFGAVNGVTPTVNGYKVYDRYGVEFEVANGIFVATKDGAYTVEVEGKYEVSGVEFKTYDTAYVDVWSQATKYKAAAVEDMFSANAWEYQSTQKQSFGVGEYTVGGETGKTFRFKKSGDNITLTLKPFYTKQYYVNLLNDETTDYVFGLNVYFDGANYPNAPTMSTARSIFADYGKCVFAKNIWLMQVADLSKFVEKYDDLVAGYELQSYNIANKIKQGYAVNGDWKNYVFYAEMSSRADYVYIKDMEVYPIETSNAAVRLERPSDQVPLTSLSAAFDGMNFTPEKILKAAKDGLDVATTDETFTVGLNDGEYEVLVQGLKNGVSTVVKLTAEIWIETLTETLLVERTGETVTLSQLTAAFEGSGFTPNKILQATRNGVSATVEDDKFTVGAQDGVYVVVVEGTANGVTKAVRLDVDVWSEASKYVAVALDDIYSVGGYSYQSHLRDTLTLGEYTLGGKTQTLLQVYAAGRECSVVVGKPLHSKKYYQTLLAQDEYYTSYVTMSWYFDNTSGHAGSVTPYYDMFSGYVSKGAQEKDTWLSGKITLEKFVELYDDIVAIYDRTVSEEIADVKYGRFVDKKGVVNPDGEVQKGYIMATKFQTNKIDNAYFTPMTIEAGEMKTLEGETTLLDRSSETKLSPTLTADEQAVVDFWSNAGYTITYQIIKRYSDGTPLVQGGTLTAATYNFVTDASAAGYTEDGIYYLYVKATKGDDSGVCVSKTYDIYDSTETIVEYENFKHSDSQYALKIYWAKFEGQAYTYTADTTWDLKTMQDWDGVTVGNVAFGTGTDANTLYLLRQDKTTLTKGTGTSATADTAYIDREVGYIAYDWATQDTLDKLASYTPTGYQYIFTYVLPRHSKAYYQAFASECTGNFEMLYKSTEKANTSGIGKMRYVYAKDIADGKMTIHYTGNVWSSNNQTTAININMSKFIENYEYYAAGQVPMLVMQRMYGVTIDSSESRLYEMGFHKTANE